MKNKTTAQIAYQTFQRWNTTDYAQSNSIHEKWFSDCKPDGKGLTYNTESYVFKDGSVFVMETYPDSKDYGYGAVAPSVEAFVEENMKSTDDVVKQVINWMVGSVI